MPHSVDLHVGVRLRALRKAAGVTQQALAKTLNLTFQQVQKYENGANRISASKLHEIACTLQVPIEGFFEGLPDAHRDRPVPAIDMLGLPRDEAIQFLRSYERMPPAVKRHVLGLVKALADNAPR